MMLKIRDLGLELLLCHFLWNDTYVIERKEEAEGREKTEKDTEGLIFLWFFVSLQVKHKKMNGKAQKLLYKNALPFIYTTSNKCSLLIDYLSSI